MERARTLNVWSVYGFVLGSNLAEMITDDATITESFAPLQTNSHL